MLIGIEYSPSEIWVPFGRVIVQLCSVTQIVVIVNTLNRYYIMFFKIVWGDRWRILLVVALWVGMLAVADMNWPSHMGPQNVLVDGLRNLL